MKVSSLPKGWRSVKFGDLVRKVNDRVDPESSGISRYVAGEHMDSDNLNITRWGVVGDGYLGPAFTMRFQPGQILYGSRRTYLRKVAMADFEGICANTTFVLESKSEELLQEFLPHVMSTETFHEYSISKSKGSVNPYINFVDLNDYEFVLPPIADQHRIVTLMTDLDQVINYFQSVPLHLLEVAIWRDQLRTGEIEFSTVGQECEIQKGKKPPKTVDVCENGLPYLTADVLRGQQPTQFVLPTSLETCNVLEGNETLILWDGAGAGDVFHGQPGVVASTMARVLPSRASRLLPEYLFHALRHLSKEIKSTTRGSTVPHVAPVSFQKLPLIIPSVHEQKQVVSSLSAIQEFKVKVENHLEALGQIRKTYLNEIGRIGLLDV